MTLVAATVGAHACMRATNPQRFVQAAVVSAEPGGPFAAPPTDVEVLEPYEPDTSVRSVRFGRWFYTVPRGDTTALGFHVRGADGEYLVGRPVTLTFSDSTVVRIVDLPHPHTPLLVGLKDGATTLTVTVEGKAACARVVVGDWVPEDVAPCTITHRAVSVDLLPANTTAAVGQAMSVFAYLEDIEGEYVFGNKVKWTVSDSTLARIESVQSGYSNGAVIVMLRPGTATITATSEGMSDSATITIVDGSLVPKGQSVSFFR